MKKRYGRNTVTVTVALLLIGLFAFGLAGSLMAVGTRDGEINAFGNDPTGGFVSVGAPRSQLALKQMFDSMGAVRTNGNRTVYEPITEEYLASVKSRIENGESPMLSVEEVLYIISDTVALADKYDGVKLHGVGTVMLRRNESLRPTHLTALMESGDLLDIIIYRVTSLCAPDSIEYRDNEIRYYPDLPKKSGGRVFVFTSVSDGTSSDNITFLPGNGQSVSLYPEENVSKSCNVKYMSLNDTPFTQNESSLLAASGYDLAYCRNITPEYWYGYTECRLAVSGGRVIIIDPVSGRTSVSAPEGMRTVSHALADSDGDGVCELYFTAYSEGKGAAIRYTSDADGIEILFYGASLMGAYESLDGDGVDFYSTEPAESSKYLNLMYRIGSSIEE